MAYDSRPAIQHWTFLNPSLPFFDPSFFGHGPWLRRAAARHRVAV